MIVDTLEHLLENEAAYGDKIQKGLQFLRDTDFTGQAAGHHEINGEMFYIINEYTTKPAGECFWEAHRIYLDLHYILEGTERIGYTTTGELKVRDAYSAEKDAIFFTGELKSAITAGPGTLVVCYPQDGHMTGIEAGGGPEAVRKVVMKIKL
ncbi:YhcH/YjgK/YiaL family protein [Paenibacillus sp. MMS20-IR301]|uniref:YhcH/YjgK/YiaL family protein n=1 Tax=Paenibacillus sp. MMS20-IR301 TaxID=2895946 RepID=UPI0028EC244F|nr:YhcH/YjgK/YiaL family protein [Paenibacillus sp. MMS20-IR301]WNS41155.1 YhcH/YjgK/YiaL family protein [Paenibacillus sp. MMS20-IR301]